MGPRLKTGFRGGEDKNIEGTFFIGCSPRAGVLPFIQFFKVLFYGMPLPGAGGHFLFYSKKKVTKESAVWVRRPFLQKSTRERKQPPKSDWGAKRFHLGVTRGKKGAMRSRVRNE